MSQEDVYAKTVHSEYADVQYIEIPIYKTNPTGLLQALALDDERAVALSN